MEQTAEDVWDGMTLEELVIQEDLDGLIHKKPKWDEVAELANKKLGFFMENAGTYFCKILSMDSDGGLTKVWDH